MTKFLSIFIICIFSCSGTNQNNFDFTKTKEKLIPYHEIMGKPLPGDWLSIHTEKSISLNQYQKKKPIRPDEKRNKIYLQPIGTFSSSEMRIIAITKKYLSCFYNLETVLLPQLSDTLVPEKKRRYQFHAVFDNKGNLVEEVPDSNSVQLQTKYILYNLLKERLPKDAAVMIALCNKDLYPDETYNFVFGQALLKERVGVWSYFRFGNPNRADEFKLVLLRTLKTASHETGHMFSINHCSKYYCIMNGSNHLEESDNKPTCFCPDCLEKFCWNFDIQPEKHFIALHNFWKEEGFEKEALLYQNFLNAIK